MIWKVYCDSDLIYHSNLPEYVISEPELELELNKTGSFTFTIYPDHPNYDKINKLKSIITVYQDDYLYFRGRVLNDTIGFYNERQVSCEGELAFLLDSIQRPFSFPENDGDTATPEAYFSFLINRHNSQVPASHQFVIGTVTVTDPNDYISRSDAEYESTWDLLNSGLIDTHGGYLWVDSDDAGNRRINYYADFDVLSNQSIEFGKNLLELSTERTGEDVCTAILPLGKSDDETEERVTISDLIDEETSDVCKSGDIVYSKLAEAIYGGRITKVVTWDSVTQSSNLLRKAKSELAARTLQEETIKISAADLSAAGYDVNGFHIGTYVYSKSDKHEINDKYLIEALDINLQNPSDNSITIGDTKYTLTEQNQKDVDEKLIKIESNITSSQTAAIRELEQRTQASIQQNSTQILNRVSNEYYTKDQTNRIVSGVSTELKQTEDAFEFRFDRIETNSSEIQKTTDSNFAEIRKYIRFEDGNIVLGNESNTQKQIITNTQNQFVEGNSVVAYIGNKKLYIYDGEFLNSLKLGKFAFLPRNNGNLSFKKVTE